MPWHGRRPAPLVWVLWAEGPSRIPSRSKIAKFSAIQEFSNFKLLPSRILFNFLSQFYRVFSPTTKPLVWLTILIIVKAERGLKRVLLDFIGSVGVEVDRGLAVQLYLTVLLLLQYYCQRPYYCFIADRLSAQIAGPLGQLHFIVYFTTFCLASSFVCFYYHFFPFYFSILSRVVQNVSNEF